MNLSSWLEFYQSDLQSVWALLGFPLAFLIYRAARAPRHETSVAPGCARFVDRYSLLFAVLTLLDPLCTGPLLGWLGWKTSPEGQVVAFTFVYLGDFRVLALLFGIALAGRGLPRALGIAAAASFVVPAIAGTGYALLGWRIEHVPIGVLWLIYEFGFLTLALGLALVWIPAQRTLSIPTRAFLRDVAWFAALYYALWAASDLLINVAGLDAGWALRIVPNQLYYGLFVPFVYFRFFGFGGRAGR